MLPLVQVWHKLGIFREHDDCLDGLIDSWVWGSHLVPALTGTFSATARGPSLALGMGHGVGSSTLPLTRTFSAEGLGHVHENHVAWIRLSSPGIVAAQLWLLVVMHQPDIGLIAYVSFDGWAHPKPLLHAIGPYFKG